MSKHKHTPAKDKYSRIERWLLSEDWSTNRHAPMEGWAWILAGVNVKTTLLFMQPSRHPDRVLIQGEIKVDDEQQRAFNALPSEKRDVMIWELRFALLQMGVEFVGIQLPLESIFLRKSIYEDGLTKDAFMQRARDVHRAILLVQWTLARHYQEPTDEEPDQGFFIN